MCGIVGYIGKTKDIKQIVNKLELLEYRGYDSAGLFAKNDEEEVTVKSVGNIETLKQKVNYNFGCNLAIAHTRWATHGKPNEANCHPHSSYKGEWKIVHNGIIENYLEIKEKLIKNPKSDSDTAAVAEFLYEQKCKNILNFIDVFAKLDGSFAIAAINKNQNKLYLAKRRSPLYVAKSKDGWIVASDIICFSEETESYYSFLDDEFAIIENNEIIFYDKNKKIVQKLLKNIEKIEKNEEKFKFSHFMQKEILEQPEAIDRLINRYKDKKLLKKFDKNYVKNINKIVLVGCGTAYHACQMGARYFEEIAGIEAFAEVASEFVYKKPLFVDKKTLIIAVSQSGETADTIRAIEIAKKYNAKTLSMVNVEYSTMASLADDMLPICAGVERAVASTKAYSCQLATLYMLASYFSQKYVDNVNNLFSELKQVGEEMLNFDMNEIEKIAEKIKDKDKVIFIGKDLDYVSAQEASLKLKEVSYINSSAYYSGELKHGFLALVEEDTPIFVFANRNEISSKTLNAAAEAKSRGGEIYIFGNEIIKEKNAKIVKNGCKNEYLSQIVAIVPLQWLAYRASVLKNLNPDKPRNLAKSVTVE